MEQKTSESRWLGSPGIAVFFMDVFQANYFRQIPYLQTGVSISETNHLKSSISVIVFRVVNLIFW